MLLFTWIPTLLGLTAAGGFVYLGGYPTAMPMAMLAVLCGAAMSLVVAACYGLSRLLQTLTSLHLITLAGATRGGRINFDVDDNDIGVDPWDGLTVDAQEG